MTIEVEDSITIMYDWMSLTLDELSERIQEVKEELNGRQYSIEFVRADDNCSADALVAKFKRPETAEERRIRESIELARTYRAQKARREAAREQLKNNYLDGYITTTEYEKRLAKNPTG